LLSVELLAAQGHEEADMSKVDADLVDSPPPGSSMERLIRTFGDAPDTPADLSERHDQYLARALEAERERGQRPATDT
jgi:hypothetical protein